MFGSKKCPATNGPHKEVNVEFKSHYCDYDYCDCKFTECAACGKKKHYMFGFDEVR